MNRGKEKGYDPSIILELKIINRIFNRSFVASIIRSSVHVYIITNKRNKKLLQDYPEYFNKFLLNCQMDLKTLGIFEIA